jgi:hypothetical protein
MNVRIVTLALGLTALMHAGIVLAEEPPAAVPPSGGMGGGIKELPGTVKKDAGDAVKKDIGGMMPGSKDTGAQAGKAGAPKGDDEEDTEEDDEEE